ncbi:MAG: hypothetical protein LBK58_07045, partial [Prevotellaceae bacterium]|nr:hypothetical protein [Prevotellaceae bacterium]
FFAKNDKKPIENDSFSQKITIFFSNKKISRFSQKKFSKTQKNSFFANKFYAVAKIGKSICESPLTFVLKIGKIINDKNEYDKKDTYNARQFYNCFWYNSGNPEEGVFVENNNQNIVNMFDNFEFYRLQI